MLGWISNIGWTAAVVGVGCLLIGLVVAWVVWRASRPLSSRTSHGMRIDAHSIHAVDDLIVECLWRTTMSVTNVSRRPRPVPVFASRATVTAGRKVYLASVFVERDLWELNPDEVAVVQVDCLLAAGAVPRKVELVELRGIIDSRRLQLRLERQPRMPRVQR